MDGYKEFGVAGAVRGAGVGVLGLFAKPISAFADIITRGTQAVGYMASLDHLPGQREWPLASVCVWLCGRACT